MVYIRQRLEESEPDINIWFGAAAALSALLAAAHVIGGTPEFLTPIVTSDLSAGIRAVAAIV